MLFEQLLIFVAIFLAIFMIGIPLIKLVKALIPVKKDPLAEAKIRLEVARKEAEAARLNQETDKIYNQICNDIVDDSIYADERKEKGINGKSNNGLWFSCFWKIYVYKETY